MKAQQHRSMSSYDEKMSSMVVSGSSLCHTRIVNNDCHGRRRRHSLIPSSILSSPSSESLASEPGLLSSDSSSSLSSSEAGTDTGAASSSSYSPSSFPVSTEFNSECPTIGSTLTFELITGHVYTSPADTVTMIPGVLHLSECLDHCRSNQSCKSLNFETGLCVLLSSSAIQRPFALTPSQFPVFTIYAHKVCLTGLNATCDQSGWSFERVRGYELREHERRMVNVKSRIECMQACVDERRFVCRSANYEDETHECWLSDMNRNTININTEIRSKKYGPSSGNIDYLEYNCVREPRKMCDFKPLEGKILKTVDSVYQDVKNLEECQQRCLTGVYKCHSYDFGDPSNPVCRTSHLDKVALAHIENPYIEIGGAVTYELQNCYDVAIQCRSKEMVAKVRSSRIFDGKIYAKRKPHHCMTDVTESLEFEIAMSYNDLECDVKQPNRGQYSNDIVIQHHDMIVTTSDLGLNINCKYDLSNKSISNNVNLAIDGNLQPIGAHSAVVGSPNVTMKITDENGEPIRAAKVGDSLLLRFEIADNFKFMLIDTDGCPTDLVIMKPIEKMSNNGQILETRFEAFKFPTSDIVQFKALITPCVANCEPSRCNINLPSGRTSQTISYGRRRRRHAPSNEMLNESHVGPVLADDADNVIVVESLSVTDKFNGPKKNRRKIEEDEHSQVYSTFADDDWIQTHNLNRFNEINSSCLNVFSIIIFSVAFLIGQTILLVSWSLLCKRSSKMSLIDSENIYGSSNWSVRTSKVPPQSPHQQMNSTKNFNPYSSNELNQTYFTPQTRQNGPSFIYA
ncbi:hypothetical protein BLOT_013474 [Blomia tropicalis]|nr:hypothetical protein BLOT_013474 [Blomia tropicalis]